MAKPKAKEAKGRTVFLNQFRKKQSEKTKQKKGLHKKKSKLFFQFLEAALHVRPPLGLPVPRRRRVIEAPAVPQLTKQDEEPGAPHPERERERILEADGPPVPVGPLPVKVAPNGGPGEGDRAALSRRLEPPPPP